MMPNGNIVPPGAVSNCQICHVFASGGPRNAFGLAVNQFVSPNGQEQFWSSVFNLDSDGDGFSNGLERGDPDGTGFPQWSTGLSGPGDPTSTPNPPNQAPTFTSSPVTNATIGVAYQYQATAQDPENGPLNFSLVSPPAWLSINGNGLLSGTPPDGEAGGRTITVRVSDNGGPPAVVDQVFTLQVAATFDGWVNLHFNPQTEAALAVPGGDPDNDQIPNLHEYLMRLNPRQTDNAPISPLTFTGNGQATFFLDVRDDDAALVTAAEVSTNLPFAPGTTTELAPVVSDPTPGDGLRRLTFTDDAATAPRRFLRLRVTR